MAANLSPLAERHADTVVLAAGVSSTSCQRDAEFQREAELLYQTARDCRSRGDRLVFFSSAAEHMYADCPGRENGPVWPRSPYGRHKLAMEHALALSGADYLILRLAYVVGANQRPHALLPGLIQQIRSGTVDVYRGAYRDLIAVDDLVLILDALLAKGISRTVVNVASGHPVSSARIVSYLQRRLSRTAVWRCVDRPTRYRVDTARLGDLVPAVAELGFDASYYRRVVARYVDHYV